MTTAEIVVFVLYLLSFVCGVFMLALLFFVGKTRIKKIDKVVYGYEFPHDSIFALMIRVPSYAGGFIWKWSAKRTGLTGKIEHFDWRFRWPFIAIILLAIMMFLLAIIGTLIKNYFGIE